MSNRILLIEHPLGNATSIKTNKVSISQFVNESAIHLPEGVGDDSILIRGPVQRANVENKNRRIYPRAILNREMNKLQEAINTNGGFLGELDHPECFLYNFDVLTEDGWKSHDDVNVGDKIATLNIETNEIEYNLVQRKIKEKYDGLGYRVKGRNIDCIVTPNHRFLLTHKNKEFFYRTVEEINFDRKFYNKYNIPKTGIWTGKSPNTFTFSALDLDEVRFKNIHSRFFEDLELDIKTFVRLLGIWLAEGSVSPTEVSVCQSKTHTTKLIRELWESLPDNIIHFETLSNDISSNELQKTVFVIRDKRIAKYFMKMGNCYTKYIPKEVKQLDSELLSELIFWFLLGDGRIQENNAGIRMNLFSVSKKLVEDLHECVIKTGGSGNWTICAPPKEDYIFAGHTIKASNKKTLYQLNISSTNNICLDDRFLTIEETYDHDQIARSFTVKNSNYYVKINNKSFWTGNSATVGLQKVPMCVRKLWWDDKNTNEMYCIAEILDPTINPSAGIAYSIIKSGIPLGISSRGLGSVQSKDGVSIVQEDFEMLTFDLVSDPSTHGALLRHFKANSIKESKEKALDINSDLKKEIKGWHLAKGEKQEIEKLLDSLILKW